MRISIVLAFGVSLVAVTAAAAGDFNSAVLRGSRAYEAPLGPTEEALAAIWQELLGLPRVGRRDHFFELGGHSLTAVQLAARVRERFDLELPLRALFECPQLAALADRLVGEQLASFDGGVVDDVAESLAGLSEDELRALLAKEDQE